MDDSFYRPECRHVGEFYHAIEKIRCVLELPQHLVGVSYLDGPVPGPTANEVIACQAIQEARAGHTVFLSECNSRCLGASYFLGFVPFDEKALAFWAENEQSLSGPYAGRNMVSGFPSPPAAADKTIVFFPVCESDFIPDLVIIACRPVQATRLLGLSMFWNGTPAQVYAQGASCQTAIGIPAVTGSAGISFLDYPSREIADFDADEVLVTLPAIEIQPIAAAIPKSINGTAETRFNNKGMKFLKGKWRRPW